MCWAGDDGVCLKWVHVGYWNGLEGKWDWVVGEGIQEGLKGWVDGDLEGWVLLHAGLQDLRRYTLRRYGHWGGLSHVERIGDVEWSRR